MIEVIKTAAPVLWILLGSYAFIFVCGFCSYAVVSDTKETIGSALCALLLSFLLIVISAMVFFKAAWLLSDVIFEQLLKWGMA